MHKLTEYSVGLKLLANESSIHLLSNTKDKTKSALSIWKLLIINFHDFAIFVYRDLSQQLFKTDFAFIEKINTAQNSWKAGVYPEYEKMTIEEMLRRRGGRASKLAMCVIKFPNRVPCLALKPFCKVAHQACKFGF